MEDVYPLTPMQKGMLFHSLLDPESGAYFEQATFEVEGELHLEAFQSSLNQLVQRHAIFRTNFINCWNEDYIQVVFKQRKVSLNYIDFRNCSKNEISDLVTKNIIKDKNRKFNLQKDDLIRMTIIQVGEKNYQFIWSFHHILMDGWCVPIVVSEIFNQYFAHIEGRIAQVSKNSSYRDYIEWLNSKSQEEALTYWKEYLKDYEGQATLPSLKMREIKGEKPSLNNKTFNLGKELTTKLKQLSYKYQVTVNVIMQAAWGILLQKYNANQDVVFGSVVSGRPEELRGIENMVGLFINTIPTRIACQKNDLFSEIVKVQQQAAIKSHDYDYYPLYEIQTHTEQKQHLISNLMVFENYPIDNFVETNATTSSDLLKVKNQSMSEQTSYDFNIIIIPGENIQIHFLYNNDIYQPSDTNRFKCHLLNLLEEISINPDIKVSQLSLLNEEENESIKGFVNPYGSYKVDQTIHNLFEIEANLAKDNTAIVYKDKHVTYGELNSKSNQLARVLIEKGVQINDLVAFISDRSDEMIVILLAILKAGAAFLPVDPSLPTERISYILKDSCTKFLICLKDDCLLDEFKEDIIFINYLDAQSKINSNLSLKNEVTDLMYMIYTSGTTGYPKGVLLEHKTLVNLITHQMKYTNLLFNKTLQFAALSFDVCYQEIFSTLLSGGILYIVDEETKQDIYKLSEFIQENKIQTIFFPTAFFKLIGTDKNYMESIGKSVDYIITAGEQLIISPITFQLINANNIKLYNHYGPSESHVISMLEIDPENFIEIPSIGKPISNNQIYILDKNKLELPIGVTGELYLSGMNLARGYHNRADLNQTSFLNHLYDNNKKMYKTGDLGRWLPDGNIEYLGRSDTQVKIRGYRIEISEIEAQLLKFHSISGAVVMTKDLNQQKELCAYFIADHQVNISDLRDTLSNQLPEYMIPSYFVQLQGMPVTHNGKVDRRKLPEIQGLISEQQQIITPKTELEEQLLSIWQTILNKNISLTDNFFEMGGHSLKATELLLKLRKDVQVEITLKDIFKYPTVAQLTKFIEKIENKQNETIPKVGLSESYPLSSAQKRMYVLSQLEGAELTYNMPGIFQLTGDVNYELLQNAFNQLIYRHDSLRTGFDVINGEPKQFIYTQVKFEIENHNKAQHLNEQIQKLIKPFDLKKAPLLRVHLIHLDDNKCILFIDMHHIISDGVSMDILMNELLKFYNGEKVDELEIQYKDYACWQQSQIINEELQKQREYWLSVYEQPLTNTDLPIDYQRQASQGYEGKTSEITIDDDTIGKLKKLEISTRSTAFMVYLAAYTVLLAKYSGEEDVIVGTPIAGRTQPELQSVIGMFVNTLALRNYPKQEKSFLEYLSDVKENILKAYANQNFPFEELVQELKISRKEERNPLFDSMFSLQNNIDSKIELENLKIEPMEVDIPQPAKFDLTLYINIQPKTVHVSFEYRTSLFKETMIKNVQEDYLKILREVSTNPSVRLQDIHLDENAVNDTFDNIELIF
ncbi:amino acid adenylation domain-containing protein [Paenibacillus polymyxa]|uniref:amino acid adenylation domain-containing protein n=1 Tax=Paenibacillus polymyxa TaxID=1406 RepID=UPI002AB4D123|nr:amino acid adenylation domain-containing protein [Paenibacillus polymyxa]MDY7994261.1 amino acid adenylation domain-containing protein [Paenibacillus polymyxa]MDY8120950.1 amino acid adenylation domain-containing protein [Paenibacillus polymyxa]